MPTSREPTNCPDCGVAPGDLHLDGCDMEICPACGGQKISCGCSLPWTGIWPGVEDCRHLGFWCKMIPGRGWTPCEKDDPEATEDLNRLHVEAVWNVKQQGWLRRPGPADREKPTEN